MDQKKSNTENKKNTHERDEEFQNLEKFIKQKEAQSKVLKKILKSYDTNKTTKSNQ